MSTDLRFPIGKFDGNAAVDPAMYPELIGQIAETPAKLRAAVTGLSEAQLDTPYRPEGWTVRQVVHHVPDSHVNSYIRWRFALTEHESTIMPYKEALWAELHDAKTAPVELSLRMLEAIHERWVILLKSLAVEDFQRKLTHPEHGKVNLEWMLAMYAWHGRHHTAQITALKERMGW